MSSVRLPQEQADCTTQPTNEQPCSQNSIFPDMTGSRFECLAGILQGEPLWHGKPLLNQVRWRKHIILSLKRLRQRTRSSRQTGLHETLSQNETKNRNTQTNQQIINKERKYCCWSM